MTTHAQIESNLYATIEAIGRKVGEAETYNDAGAIKREKNAAKFAVANYRDNEELLDRCRFFYCAGVRAGRIEAQRCREERRREMSEALSGSYGLHGGGNWR